MHQNTAQQQPTPTISLDFSHIVKNNPSGWILRTDLTEKTGGLIHSRTAANLDSLGVGIPGRIVMGKRKVAYPVENIINFLNARCRAAEGGDRG
jgi:hypothetical protein